MPSLRDLEIHVTDKHRNPLPEYGIQKMSKANLISCFIESKTDTPFQVSVKPTMPFPGLAERRLAAPSLPRAKDVERMRRRGGDFYNGEAWDDVMESEARDRSDEEAATEPVQPFHLLATMRLDGRERAEKSVIVYLDDADSSSSRARSGKVEISHRYGYDEEGKMRASGWVFKDVGIDDLFGAMGIDGSDGGEAEVPLTAEEDLAQAFEKLAERRLADRVEGKIGQIEITLEKIVVLRIERGAWQPPSEADNATSAGPAPSARDVAHTVGRNPTERTASTVDAIFYDKIEPGTFATFRFYYRSAETLGRFGFPGFAAGAQAPSATRKGLLAASKLASRSGVGEKGRRGREEEWEDGEAPVKEGRWEMHMAVRGGPGEKERVVGGEGEEKAVEEDEEL